MALIYGAPLPPGLEAPSRGELRIRLEKLVMDDDTLNHNPLVRYSFPGHDGSAYASSSSARRMGSSPNVFTVPIDHCAVSPLFWGEAKPSAQCQPATPQEHRAALTLVYPIKVPPENFFDYLRNMTLSPHCGLQLEVFVPSSYSGRPAVAVGKCILALDELENGRPMSGWFTVAHQQPPQHHRRGDYDDADGSSASQDNNIFIPVGKLKLHIALNFFGEVKRSASRSGKVSNANARNRTSSTKASRKQAAEMEPSMDEEDRTIECSSVSHSNNQSIEVQCVKSPDRSPKTQAAILVPAAAAEEASAMPIAHPPTATPSASAIDDLLARGMQLRQRMLDATMADPMETGGTAVNSTQPPPAMNDVVLSSADHSGTLYTSQDSDDEERFTRQLQEDEEARRSQNNKQHQRDLSNVSSQPGAKIVPRVSSRSAGGGGLVGHVASGGHASGTTVELRFTDVSFATTPMTADLTEMRINVRLSKDITTEEPTAKPFSSYVHQVPLSQAAICLNFPVRSFSEELSRLVIEVIKVRSRKIQDRNNTPHAAAAAPSREVVSEELLGLCVVGLFKQSRELVLRDPVSSLNNVYCHMCLRLRRHDGNSSSLRSAQESFFSRPQTGSKHSRVQTERATTSGKVTNETSMVSSTAARPVGEEEAALSPPAQSKSRKNKKKQHHKEVGPSDKDTHATGPVQLRVQITSATQLPLVRVAGQKKKSGSTMRALEPLALPSAAADEGARTDEDGGDFSPPNSFILLEELHSPTGEVVEGWQVESFAHGSFDRTDVFPHSRKPQYNYQSILRAPSGKPLGELQLTLWHHLQQAGSGAKDDSDSEAHFWAQAAFLGECRVDLRPLKYLPKLDGFYRVMSTGSHPSGGGVDLLPVAPSPNAKDAAATPSSADTIGHVHVSVSIVK